MSDLRRFWDKVDKLSGMRRPKLGRCWNWTAASMADGRGRFMFMGKVRLSPRVAFYFAHGRWPNDCALHRCDNPACVRPAHLFEGTLADNALDRDRKGRTARRGGELCARAKLTWGQVRRIRAEHARGGAGQRLLAKKYGVSRNAVRRIVTGDTWRE